MAARAGSRLGAPCSISVAAPLRVAGDRQRRQRRSPSRAAGPETRCVAIAELQRSRSMIALMRRAVDAEQADRRGDRRLRRRAARSAAAPPASRSDALVADLPQRKHRIVLQRAIELGDLGERRERVGALVVAERLDHRAAEEVLPLHDQRRSASSRGLRIVAVGGERARQRRPDELGLLASRAPRAARQRPPGPGCARSTRRRRRAADRSARRAPAPSRRACADR